MANRLRIQVCEALQSAWKIPGGEDGRFVDEDRDDPGLRPPPERRLYLKLHEVPAEIGKWLLALGLEDPRPVGADDGDQDTAFRHFGGYRLSEVIAAFDPVGIEENIV